MCCYCPQSDIPLCFIEVPQSIQAVTPTSHTCFKKSQPSPTLKTAESPPNTETEGDCIEIENMECHVCFTNTPDAVFEACLHGGICTNCIIESIKYSQSCTICRRPNLSFLKLGEAEGNQVLVERQYKYICS